MANKVNVKFVVILASALVVLAGVVGYVGWTVVTKTGDELERLGDQAAAAGDWTEARRYYSKAVNRDPTNAVRIQKWREAIEQWSPPTETAFLNGYQGRYLLVRRALVEAQPENVDVLLEYLDLLHTQQTVIGYSRAGSESMISIVSDMVIDFEEYPDGAPEGWQRLVRYRGLARSDIYTNGGVMEDDEVQLAVDDLQAAIGADRTDGETLAALVRVRSREAMVLRDNDRAEAAMRKLEMAQSEIASFLENDPGNPWAEVYRTVTEFDIARQRETGGMLPDEAAFVIREMLPMFRPQVERAIQAVEAAPVPVDERLVSVLGTLERRILEQPSLERTIAIAERSLEAAPEDDFLLMFVSSLHKQAGNLDASMEFLTRASELPDLPMSLDGYMRFFTRRQAMIDRVEIMLTRVVETTDLEESERERLLAESATLRDAYAEQVSGDEPQLQFVDGLRAIAEDDMSTALRLLTSYNTQTQNQRGQGLWWLGQVALQMNREGTAESAFSGLMRLQPNNLAAAAALGQAKLRLQKTEEAAELFERVLEVNPDNEALRELLETTYAVNNPDEASDPVMGVLLQAREARFGTDDVPGDPGEAERILAEGLEAHDGSADIARELILIRLDEGNIEGARSAAARALATDPDNEGMNSIARALEQDDATDVLIKLIDESGLPEIDKIMGMYNMYATRGEPELAAETLARAIEIAPDDARVLESDFMTRIARGELDGLEELTQRAIELNADQLQGLTFVARERVARNDLRGAIEAMTQAIAQGAAPPAAYRMLAAQQRAAGQSIDAIGTLEQSLELKPDDTRTIRDYIGTLEAAGRRQEALGAARRMGIYGRTDPVFVDAWLQLEASVGGAQGRELAITRREQMFERVPADRLNKIRLASLYVGDRRWEDARSLIDELVDERYDIETVELLASWYADQGRVEQDGQQRNGLDLARAAFTDYIISVPEDELTVTPWLRMAGFLLERGDADTAARALSEAQTLQDPAVMEADRILGDVLITRGRFAEAAEAYGRVVDAGADDASQTYLQRLIEANLRLGNYEQASSQLDQLNEPAASSLETLLQRSETARGLGDETSASQLLDQAIAEYPEAPLPLTLRAGRRMGDDGSMEDALADLDRALQIDPGFTNARRARAGVYFEQGRNDDALRDLREVVRQDPTQTDVAYTLINELNRAGRDREAITVANELIEQNPQNLQLVVNMGTIFLQYERWNRGAELYEIAWERSRAPAIAARLIGALLEADQPRRASEILVELEDVVPDADENPAVTAIDAIIQEARDDMDAATELLTEAFAQCEGTPGLLLGWASNVDTVFEDRTDGEAVTYLRRLRRDVEDETELRWLDLLIAQRVASIDDTRDEGLGLLTSLRETASDDPVAMLSYQVDGGTRYGAEDFDNARRVWEEGLEAFPNNWELANNLAYLLAREMDDAEAALPIAEIAVQNAPNRASPHDTLGYVYLKLDRLEEARVSLEQAQRLAQAPRVRAEVLLNRARLARASGQEGLARELLASVRELARSLGDDQARIESQIDELLGQIGSAQD